MMAPGPAFCLRDESGKLTLSGLSSLQWMYGEATRETKSWVDVDEEIFKIRQRRVGAQLPPQAPAIGEALVCPVMLLHRSG